MSKSSFLQSLLDSFRGAKDMPGDGRPGSPVPRVVPPSHDFEVRLHNALSLHGPAAASRVHLIDFAGLRTRFSDRWERSQAKVHAIVTECIQRHLAEVDVYNQFGDTSYLLVFARLSVQEAQLKCLLIVREMARRLVGSDEAAREIDILGTVLRADGQLEFRKLPQSEVLPHEQKHRPAAKKPDFLLASPVLHHLGRSVDWESIQFVFRPLLALRGMVVSTFICLPVRRTDANNFVSGYDVLPDPADPLQVGDLDLLTAAKVAFEAESMAKAGSLQGLLSLPVHFETLANQHGRSLYLKYCAEYLKPHAGRLIFELVNLPDGVPQSRLVDLTTLLRPTARAVIARFPLTRHAFGPCRAAGLHAVGSDIFRTGMDEATLIREMDLFVEAANRENLKTYIHGVRSISLNTAAIAAGFDYIDGYALSSVSCSPGQAQRYDLHSLYQLLLDGGN